MAPTFFFSAGVIDKLTTLFIYIILAVTWNALAGYGGLVSIGQQAFFGLREGPDADPRHGVLIYFTSEGSRFGGDSQITPNGASPKRRKNVVPLRPLTELSAWRSAQYRSATTEAAKSSMDIPTHRASALAASSVNHDCLLWLKLHPSKPYRL